jgi:hypothetical protein
MSGNSHMQLTFRVCYFLKANNFVLLECLETEENNQTPPNGDLDEEARIFSGHRTYIY